MKYLVTKEIQSETKIWKSLSLQDFAFLVIGIAGALILKGRVHSRLEMPFLLFSIVILLFLSMKSSTNPGRRNWQRLVLSFMKEDIVFSICEDKETESAKEEKRYGKLIHMHEQNDGKKRKRKK